MYTPLLNTDIYKWIDVELMYMHVLCNGKLRESSWITENITLFFNDQDKLQ